MNHHQTTIIRPPFIRALALNQFNSFILSHPHKCIYVSTFTPIHLHLGRNAEEATATATAITIVVDYIAAFGLFSAPLAIFEQNIFNLQFFSLYADYYFFMLMLSVATGHVSIQSKAFTKLSYTIYSFEQFSVVVSCVVDSIELI